MNKSRNASSFLKTGFSYITSSPTTKSTQFSGLTVLLQCLNINIYDVYQSLTLTLCVK